MSSTKFALAIAAATVLRGDLHAQGVCTNDAPNPYRLETTWTLSVPRPYFPANSITVARDGHIWVFDRCGDGGCTKNPTIAPVFELDPAGKALKNFGAGLFVQPHGIATDGAGNVWVADSADGSLDPVSDGKGMQVVKLDQQGKVLMRLGKPGTGVDNYQNQATAAQIAPNGDIYVADGHDLQFDNSRILKFSKDGTFIKAFGEKGSGVSSLWCPHELALDSAGRVFVADRCNNRVAIFDKDGGWVGEWRQFGRPSSLYIANDVLYVSDRTSTDDKKFIKAGDGAAANSYNPDCKRGIRIGSVKDGKVTVLIPSPPGDSTAEGVAVDQQGNIYSATTGKGGGIKKYVKAK